MRRAAALMLLRLLKTEVYCPVTGSGPAGKVASGTLGYITQKAEDVTQSQI